MIIDSKLIYSVLATVLAIVCVVFASLLVPVGLSGSDYQVVLELGEEGEVLSAEDWEESRISQMADFMIEGFVDDVEVKWDDVRECEVAFSDVTIKRFVKGVPFAEDCLELMVVCESDSQSWKDSPILNAGSKVRVYLQHIDGHISIIGGLDGVFEIHQDWSWVKNWDSFYRSIICVY
ncbi:MAG: hypothetical protein SVY53_03695 [Chloroflexota bacterium]|nr:hypothetical protein [Chloroflexota bacterium]